MKSPYFVKNSSLNLVNLDDEAKDELFFINDDKTQEQEQKLSIILENITALKRKISKNNSEEKQKCWKYHLKKLERALERKIEMIEFNRQSKF